MYRTIFLSCVSACLLGGGGSGLAATPGAAAAQRGTAPAKSSSAQPRMADFRQAKFGLFIHWGLYAIPARGEWVMNREKIPVGEYAKFAPQFNPVKFDAAQWVRIAKDAGMRYIVITSKHHDGFAMFGSKTSSYNIVDATPFRRDPLKELAQACAQEGIRLGFYYSQAQDWHHAGGAIARGPWDPAQRGDFDRYLRDISIPQVKELLAGYGPVFAIWFDTPVDMTRDRAEDFVEVVHALQPATLVNSRLFYSGRQISGLNAGQLAELREIGVDYLSYADRQIPAVPQWRDWETCMTLNNSWGYNAADDNWKSPQELVGQLVEIASKGGNFLLNVGPTAEGEIPAPSVRNLKAVGEWLAVNGEAIYGTSASPLKPAPAGETGPAWRATAKPGRLYIHLLQWPKGTITLEGIQGKVTGARLLADAAHAPLSLEQRGASVILSLPAQPPSEWINVLRLELAGDPSPH